MVRVWPFIIALLALSACAQVQTFTENDLKSAAALATATGDTTGAQCFTALQPLVAPQAIGLATKYEIFRAGNQIVSNGPCAPLAGGLLTHLLAKVPFTP